MVINVPDWCIIGKYVEVLMYDPNYGESKWFKEKIISYSEDGFFHQAHNCPVYHTPFSNYGLTVREILISR